MQVPASVFNPLMLLIEGAVIGFIIAVPVGPAAALCIRRSITVGAVAGYLTGVGAAAGDAVFGAVAAFGLSFVIEFVARNEAWLRGMANVLNGVTVGGVITMTHIEPGHIHTRVHKFENLLGSSSSRTYRADDLGPTHALTLPGCAPHAQTTSGLSVGRTGSGRLVEPCK